MSADGVSDLAAARETNRRLNRRLGEAESSLTSMIGQAQREVNMAQARTSEAQRLHAQALDCQRHLMRSYMTECARTERRPILATIVVVWALVATGLAAWWYP